MADTSFSFLSSFQTTVTVEPDTSGDSTSVVIDVVSPTSSTLPSPTQQQPKSPPIGQVILQPTMTIFVAHKMQQIWLKWPSIISPKVDIFPNPLKYESFLPAKMLQAITLLSNLEKGDLQFLLINLHLLASSSVSSFVDYNHDDISIQLKCHTFVFKYEDSEQMNNRLEKVLLLQSRCAPGKSFSIPMVTNDYNPKSLFSLKSVVRSQIRLSYYYDLRSKLDALFGWFEEFHDETSEVKWSMNAIYWLAMESPLSNRKRLFRLSTGCYPRSTLTSSLSAASSSSSSADVSDTSLIKEENADAVKIDTEKLIFEEIPTDEQEMMASEAYSSSSSSCSSTLSLNKPKDGEFRLLVSLQPKQTELDLSKLIIVIESFFLGKWVHMHRHLLTPTVIEAS